MGSHIFQGVPAPRAEPSTSFISKLYFSISKGLPHVEPVYTLRTNEYELVQGVLHMLQGFSSSLFSWDEDKQGFCVKDGIYTSHLSQTSLSGILRRFVQSGTCLKIVESFVKKVEGSRQRSPTLMAFANSLSLWLKRLRDVALAEEAKSAGSDTGTTVTLLELTNSLSSLCSGAELLVQVVYGAIPVSFFQSAPSVPAGEMAVHILNHLFNKLNEICLVQGGEEEPYHMLLAIFTASMLPFLEGLDSWLYDGILYDPCEEMFFYANGDVAIDQPSFWERSYLLRLGRRKQRPGVSSLPSEGQDQNDTDTLLCPIFLKVIAQAIVSAGKSLQLVQHVQDEYAGSNEEPTTPVHHSRVMGVLTLSEVFLISLAGLIGDGSHIYEQLKNPSPMISEMRKAFMEKESGMEIDENTQNPVSYGNICFKFLADAIQERRDVGPGNPVVTVCREVLEKNKAYWNELNISRNFRLPPLDDENLREAIFCITNKRVPGFNGTDYSFGFQFNELERLRLEDDTKALEALYPFPTILPCFQEDVPMSELLPFQKNSTLASRILCWIHGVKLKDTPQPGIIIQECVALYIKKQVDHVGKHILLKLMSDWKLMDELGVLHAVYLLGSGDLLQHFLTVIFNKLDKGDSWDDDFELNTILQESIRNSADSALLSAPDALVVCITNQDSTGDEANTNNNVTTPRKVQKPYLGIDALDMMKFTYKVPWPLDLIANTEALKKYNQVMGFLLKVKRAKFILDKARRWMWKQGRGGTTHNYKHHLLLEQKLLHFVDAFHQYVMDRVFHSAWVELCTGMASASSLDEVIEVHEAYLLSIQRQCFVAPDKLWALIASRINSILGLALEFYSVQQTLSSGGTAPAIKARCEMEVDRIEKQFDDCIAFLLRILSIKLNVRHFPHLADLVTRINYNYYYMSSSGNLNTIPSFDSSAKLGKPSAFRAD